LGDFMQDEIQIPENLNAPLNYKQLEDVEKILFGPSQSQTEGAPLEWGTFKSDNFLTKTLNKMTGLFAFALKKEAEEKMKQVENARKLFYGK